MRAMYLSASAVAVSTWGAISSARPLPLPHRFHSHLTPHSYSVCNRTIDPITGSFFCHLAKSVQADEASWPVSILSVFPVTREWLSLTKTATSPSVLTLYRFCKTCLKREIMIAATWRTCSSVWRIQRIELNGEEEPVWLTPYLRDPQPEGERGRDSD